MLFHKLIKAILGEIGEKATLIRLVHLRQCHVVSLVRDLPDIAIPSAKDAPCAFLVDLPLVDVFCDILLVGAEGVPDVDRYVIAVQVEEGNVEIETNLGRVVLVNPNARDEVRPGKGHGFRKEENRHDANGTDTHHGAQACRLGR